MLRDRSAPVDLFAWVPAQPGAASDVFWPGADNERLAHDLRIRSVALPRQGPLTPKQKEVRHSVAFRRAYRWRAGIEGHFSVL